MNTLNIILGFFEGFALIISPCILPVLPIMLAGSIAGSKRRPIGITVGFVVSFAVFAFFSRQLVLYSGIDLNTIRYIAYALLFLLGLILLSTWLTNQFDRVAQRMIGTQSHFTVLNNPQGDFLSGVMFGGLVAIVWTPCAGPILAAIIVQTVIQQSTFMSFLTLLAFAFGAAVPMVLIAIYGRQLISRFEFFKTHSVLLRKLLGVIIIVSVAYMIIQERTGITSTTIQTQIKIATRLQDGLWRPYPAPAIGGIDTWINSTPLQLSALKGHVVLVDFWTYSCINCIRTLPYLNYYNTQYRNKGLVIIGVHTPEFDFEKNPDNVRQAVKRDEIQYSVALDNQFVTWQNFQNHYWPAHYLIDKQGRVVYEHFGEGDYDVTENNIRFLLGIDSLALPLVTSDNHPSLSETPETYLGYQRADADFSPPTQHDKSVQYTFAQTLPVNAWSMQGLWQILSDKIIAKQPNASLKIHFHARHVYVVMGNGMQRPIHVSVRLNNQKQIVNAGADVHDGEILVDKESIYEVVALPEVGDGVLELITDSEGLEVYTFTFGS